jgi:periplasmic protein TonB
MKYCILILLGFITTSAFAQSGNRITREAEFPGGVGAWGKYLERNMTKELPDSAIEKYGASSLQVIVLFTIQKDGSISDVKVLNEKKHHPEMVSEAIRIIKESPKWLPALKKGKPVRSYFRQPIIWEVEMDE